MGEDLFDELVSEENESQIAGPGETTQNDPDNIPIEDINSRDNGLTQSEIKKQQRKIENSGEEKSRVSGPKPEESFWFEVVGKPSDGSSGAVFTFSPEYYPERFKPSKERETSSESDVCNGENVSVDKVKNYRIHVTGLLLMDPESENDELSTMHTLADHEGSKVDVISPLLPDEGLRCIIKTVEYGDIQGWDPHHRSWTIKYTLDFIGVGDLASESGENGIVVAVDDSLGTTELEADLDLEESPDGE